MAGLQALDEVDYKILEILKENAKTTNSNIADTVKLSEGAVRNRIKRLLKNKVIKKFTIETQQNEVEAIVLIKTQTKGSKEILRRIRQHAKRLFETAGEYDVAAHLAAENIQKINATIDRLRNANGVISTVTLLKIADEHSFEA
jgi:Lrp/AsnC family transcriptional regulator of lysine biosynthesis